jgi:thioester reductase-like protein
MAYRLITGATGLLGSYLLRDFLLREESIAVLVRPSRWETAEQRIDALLAHWEESWRRTFTRPVVLSGDIRQPLLGLDRGDRVWLGRNADRILHSAASLTFHEENGEPWASNVQGTQNVLELCRDIGVRLLEHVSTAYVCGLRSGRVLESELDVGQDFGNDYERSKAQSEKLVRSDESLDAYTVFRPSIIVGDSNTGFTSTFHGFYSPLRVAAALLASVGLHEALEVDYLALLGLEGHELKNFVPVNWVSDALITILTRETPRKQAYALVSERPVSVRRLRRVFESAVRNHEEQIERYSTSARGGRSSQATSSAVAQANLQTYQNKYVEHFAVYRSYWRDDPDFDCSNTRSVLPDLPCPEVTDGMLDTLCRFALEANFGFPPRRYGLPDFLPRDWLHRFGEPPTDGSGSTSPTAASGRIGITVTGPGGGCWTLFTNGRDSFSYQHGAEDVTAIARTTADTFEQLVHGHLSLDEVLAEARLVFYGDQATADQLRAFIRTAVSLSQNETEHGAT